MAIPRQILGPQEHFERTGAQSLRDIRPLTSRLSVALRGPASGLVLGLTAVGLFFEPAVVDLAVPAALLYALWVLTRRVELPLRLPKSSGLLDASNPTPGSRKPKRAAGSLFLGWSITGQELWITAEDARQHMTIPGTTGAGKTTAILSLLSNALAQGSGFVLVDGKADRDLFGKVLALARRFGRDDDVRVLNFMVASGVKDSNTFNPFATGNADAIRELLASQLGEQSQSDANGVFRGRAVALIGTLAPALVWLRDNKGVPLNIDFIRFSIELRWIWKLAMQQTYVLRDTETGAETEINVSGEIPEDIIWPLKAYLGELPGYDRTVPLDKQKGEEPSKQHGFAQFYFTETFTQLAVSLGHIFRCESGDIDMRDIVLNRRILVVNLPALENSDATLAALGKLVVAALRGMMAQLLGASLEGDYTEADKPGMGPSPFLVALDEVAYFVTSGVDRMLAMGRGINMSFLLGFQEASGIWARLGEKTASLFGNANLTIAMRQQDAGRTREWLEKTAGQTNITQGHVLSWRQRRQLPGGAPRRREIGLAGGLARPDIADRGRGDRAVRLASRLCPPVPRPDRRRRPQADRPQHRAVAAKARAGACGAEPVRRDRRRHRGRPSGGRWRGGGLAGARRTAARLCRCRARWWQRERPYPRRARRPLPGARGTAPAPPTPAGRRHAGHRRHADVVLRQPGRVRGGGRPRPAERAGRYAAAARHYRDRAGHRRN